MLSYAVGGIAVLSAGCLGFYLYFGKTRRGGGLQARSTTSSTGGGVLAYETTKAVDEYLLFHFGTSSEIFPYDALPKEILEFPSRCAVLCERHCTALQDFTGELEAATALDIGCAVGGATFALARAFPHVLGIDFSQKFIDAAEKMKAEGEMRYTAVEEADITRQGVVRVAAEIDRDRVRFSRGDACNLPSTLRTVDAILAANLLCRLPDPKKFLDSLPSRLKPAGIVVLVSPYSWLTAWTPKSKWIGGHYDTDGRAIRSFEALSEIMSQHFTLVDQQDMPFVIREHARKFQVGVSHATVWRKLP